MDQIAAQVDSVVNDLRRIATPGAIGDAPNRSGLLTSPMPGVRPQISPSSSPLSVSIDGAGMFALKADGRTVYTRLGKFSVDANGALTDGNGRAVLGFKIGAGETEPPVPIRVDTNERLTDLAIDEQGVLSATAARKREPVARIALALFPAPERMARVDQTAASATPASGEARYFVPGAANVGTLAPRTLESGTIDLEAGLERLWRLQQRGELTAAQAFAADQCTRDALGLVK